MVGREAPRLGRELCDALGVGGGVGRRHARGAGGRRHDEWDVGRGRWRSCGGHGGRVCVRRCLQSHAALRRDFHVRWLFFRALRAGRQRRCIELAPELILEDFRWLGALLGLFYGWCSPLDFATAPRPGVPPTHGSPWHRCRAETIQRGSRRAAPRTWSGEHTKHRLLSSERVRDGQQL